MLYCESTSYAKIWEIENAEKYSTVKMSTSRKNKANGEWVNSNWNFIRFVGKAHDKCLRIGKGSRITNLKFSIDNEPYKNKNGETVYPQRPKIVVYDFEIVDGGGQRQEKFDDVTDGTFAEELPF